MKCSCGQKQCTECQTAQRRLDISRKLDALRNAWFTSGPNEDQRKQERPELWQELQQTQADLDAVTAELNAMRRVTKETLFEFISGWDYQPTEQRLQVLSDFYMHPPDSEVREMADMDWNDVDPMVRAILEDECE